MISFSKVWKLWTIYDTIEADEIKETKTMENGIVTPGWKTSEFWIHLLTYVPTVAAIFLPAASPVLLGLTVVAHFGSAFYTAQRSGVKIAAMAQSAAPSVAQIAQAAADALDQAAKSAQAAAPAPIAAPAAPALPKLS